MFDGFTANDSLVIRVRDTIENSIIRNELKPEMRLKETHIGQQLGISRAPVREALRFLESEGLVINRPRKGFTVAPLKLRQALDIYEVRLLLEGTMAAMAATNADEDSIRELQEIVASMNEAVSQGNVLAYIHSDIEFHRCIYKSTKNDVLIEMMNSLWKKCKRYLYVTNSQSGEMEDSVQKHQRLADAIIEGDAELARRISLQSLEEAKQLLVTSLRAAGIGDD